MNIDIGKRLEAVLVLFLILYAVRSCRETSRSQEIDQMREKISYIEHRMEPVAAEKDL